MFTKKDIDKAGSSLRQMIYKLSLRIDKLNKTCNGVDGFNSRKDELYEKLNELKDSIKELDTMVTKAEKVAESKKVKNTGVNKTEGIRISGEDISCMVIEEKD